MLRRGRKLLLPPISATKKQNFAAERRSPSALIPPEAESISSRLCDPSLPVEDLLKRHGGGLSSELVLGVLANYKKLGRGRTLAFFSWAGNRLSYRFDDDVVEFMADFLARRKLFDDLKCFLLTIHSSNGRISSRAISICIRFLGRSGRISEALSLFETMESELNCPPDNIVFNNVLYMLCRISHTEDSMDAALTFFRRIGCPDEFSYSNILLGLCKSGRIDSALKVFDEMLERNLVPTRTAANVLVGELCKQGFKKTEKLLVRTVRRPFDIVVPPSPVKNSMDSILKVFRELRKRGFLPSSFVTTHLISELLRLGMIQEAVEILKAAASKSPIAFHESYNTAIRALCKARKLTDALELLQMMVSQGLNPKPSIYTSIIAAFCKLGDLDGAHRYLQEMIKMRCEPESGAYAALVHAHCGIQSWELAYKLVMEMVGLGIAPTPETEKLVGKLLRQNGRDDLLVKLETRMECLLLDKLCVRGNLRAAYEKLVALTGEGVDPPPYMIHRLEVAFRGSQWWKSVHELLN